MCAHNSKRVVQCSVSSYGVLALRPHTLLKDAVVAKTDRQPHSTGPGTQWKQRNRGRLTLVWGVMLSHSLTCCRGRAVCGRTVRGCGGGLLEEVVHETPDRFLTHT